MGSFMQRQKGKSGNGTAETRVGPYMQMWNIKRGHFSDMH